MWTLIGREFREINLARNYKNSTRVFLIIYGMLGIGFPIILWLLGPGLVGIFDVEYFNEFVSIVGMVLIWQTLSNSLVREGANRQMRFLQTLPIRKRDIVHAKFLSVLLLCGCTIVWIALFISLNMVISGTWTTESWALIVFFLSFIIFMNAVTLLPYFLWGYKRITLVSLLSLLVWSGVFVLFGFFMDRAGKEPSIILAFMGFMILSLVTYLVFWWVSVRRVNKKGFPIELVNAVELSEEGNQNEA